MFERGKINLGFVVSATIAGLIVLGVAFAVMKFHQNRDFKPALTPAKEDEPSPNV